MSSVANTFFPNNVANSNEINIPGLKVSQNRISLSTDDSERLWIDSQGKVGIGTSNPNQLLHLYQADSNEVQLKITNADTTNGVLIGLTADEDFQIKSRDTGKHIFIGTNDGTDMTIEAGGNVGIGTTNPSELLHINNSTGGSTQIRFTNADGGSSLMGIDSSEDVVIKERAGNNLKFFVNDLEKMRIDTNGNVGIGTDDPVTILHLENTTPSLRMTNGTYSFDMGQNVDGEIDMHNISNAGNIAFNYRNNSGSSICKLNNDLSVNFTGDTTIDTSGNLDMNSNSITNATSITATNLTGTLQTSAQTNITSLGTLTSLNVTGNLTVDSNTLFIDSSNNKIGIGTTNPDNKLEIWGDVAGDSFNALKLSNNSASGSDVSMIFSTGTIGANVGKISCTNEGAGVRDLTFSTFTGATLTEKVRIEGGGNVGIGTNNPNKILDITSTTSGILPPRMTTTQRDAMTPIAGEMIYNTTTNKHQGYNGTTWSDFY